MANNKNNSESHPHFPSGEWEGFYTYGQGTGYQQHRMAFSLDFKGGIITGGGSDDVGGFAWKGHYELDRCTCQITKHYATHTVFYKGHADENGIWGMWQMPYWQGGFHIWPKKNNSGNAKTEQEAEEKVMEKVKIQLDILRNLR